MNNSFPLHPLLQQRRSIFAFSSTPVEQEKIISILEAARWSPSSFNEQPWHYILATKEMKKEYDILLQIVNESNAQWVQNAPVIILSVTKLIFDRNGKPNRYAFHDVGIAFANMTLQAVSLGLSIHPMGGFDKEKSCELLKIPEGYEPVSVIALGYQGDEKMLSEEIQQKDQKPRERKKLQEFVYSKEWGIPSPIIL